MFVHRIAIAAVGRVAGRIGTIDGQDNYDAGGILLGKLTQFKGEAARIEIGEIVSQDGALADRSGSRFGG